MFITSASTDRIAAGGACSYGLFWAISLFVAILDRKDFHPNIMYYIAAGCALFYVASAILTLCRIKGATRLLQMVTAVITVLVLVAFGMVFYGEKNLLGRGLIVAFAQLQVMYGVCLWLLLGHKSETE